MTDEEILERLAVIEGVAWDREFLQFCEWVDGRAVLHDAIGAWAIAGVRFDPLNNDAQAMGLMRKHEMDVRCNDEGNWSACVPRRYGHYPIVLDADLNRAIAMAVVVAHGGGDVAA